MITELTQAQIDLFPEYVAKWTAVRDNTDRFTAEEATTIIQNFQTEILQSPKTPVVVFDNPKTLWAAIEEKFGEKIKFVPCYQDGSFFVYVFSYYDYLLTEGIVKIDADLKRKFDVWVETSKLGLIYPLEDVCYVTQKQIEISYNDKKQLHCENGMAMEYVGYGLYSLNGINVPEYLVMTPSEDLDINFFKNEKNADVKAEFVRKYGVERMLDLGKKLDTYENYDREEHAWWWNSEYELWDMTVLFEGLNYQPYIKMKNGTTGIWHMEAVSPSCTTLELAIKERFGGKDVKIINIK